MTLCVFALTTDRRVPDVPGTRLRLAVGGQVHAIVADARKAPAATPASLRRYHRIIAALAVQRTSLLPARFGTIMSDDELAFILRSRNKTLKAALAHVRGTVQMTLRLVADVPRVQRSRSAGPRRRSGTAYLREIAAESRQHHVAGLDAVRAGVARWVRDERVEVTGGVISVYHLVPRRSAGAYAKAVTAASEAAGVHILVSGPFAPFAFSRF